MTEIEFFDNKLDTVITVCNFSIDLISKYQKYWGGGIKHANIVKFEKNGYSKINYHLHTILSEFCF